MHRKLSALLVLVAALAAPAFARADGAPSPADTACRAEYVQLGADAFTAKYGSHEAYGACLKAHSAATTPEPPATAPSPADTHQTAAQAACTAEYVQLGADAFTAKYGSDEAYGACLKAHSAATTPEPPATAPSPADTHQTAAQAACTAEYVKLGTDAFKARYGAHEPYPACLQAHESPTTTEAPSASPPPTTSTSGDAKSTHRDIVASVASGLCTAQAKALGATAYLAKYGPGETALAACSKATLPQAQSLVASCVANGGVTTGDALKRCVATARKHHTG